MNCNKPCTPVCNTGTPTCDAQNKQACDLQRQKAQACEDKAYDKIGESFVNMGQSWTTLFVVGALFVLYGIVRKK